MATPTKYTKSISNDFPNQKVNLRKLEKEISLANISKSINYSGTFGDEYYVWFKDVLSAPEETIFDQVISSHTGEADPPPAKVFKMQEENVSTGGNYATKSICIESIPPNTTSHKDVWWNYDISGLNIIVTFHDFNEGDSISMIVAPEKTIGILSNDITQIPGSWSNTNYVSGNSVTYENPSYENTVETYTCVFNTVSNETPENISYWVQGYKLYVSSSVVKNTMKGYNLIITDGTNTDDLGAVLNIGTNYVLVENAPQNTYSSGSLIKQNVYTFKDFNMARNYTINLGSSKVGASFLPAKTKVRLEYKNNSSTETRRFNGIIEYLY